jgi:hypothetical protein
MDWRCGSSSRVLAFQIQSSNSSLTKKENKTKSYRKNNFQLSLSLLIFRFVAKPCAIALNIQANGPQIAQPNAILEKVFTAITKVCMFVPRVRIVPTTVPQPTDISSVFS